MSISIERLSELCSNEQDHTDSLMKGIHPDDGIMGIIPSGVSMLELEISRTRLGLLRDLIHEANLSTDPKPPETTSLGPK